MLYNYEKKGFIVLLIIIVLIIILPQQFKKRNHGLFLLSDLEPIELYEKREKENTLIELNSADSATLTTVKGIGPIYASRIINYRNRLGGYYNIEQLKELNLYYLNVDSIFQYFSVNRSGIQIRKLDTLTFQEVLAHPYLNYENVKSIFNAKNKFSFITLELLKTHEVLSDTILIKIEPYFQ